MSLPIEPKLCIKSMCEYESAKDVISYKNTKMNPNEHNIQMKRYVVRI